MDLLKLVGHLVDGSGTVVASGGAPYSGTACLADDCYTYEHD